MDSLDWQQIRLPEVGIQIKAPASWGICELPSPVILCLVDSSVARTFRTNLDVSLHPRIASLGEYSKKTLEEMVVSRGFRIVENSSNPVFWTDNVYTSYLFAEQHGDAKVELGLWSFAFFHKNMMVEMSLAGEARNVEELDFLFKTMVNQIDSI